MSTGDYHTHKHSELFCHEGSGIEYYEFDTELNDLINYVA